MTILTCWECELMELMRLNTKLKTQLVPSATASGSRRQACHTPDAVCTVFELLMMGGETACNM
jgi:hypothetical protein